MKKNRIKDQFLAQLKKVPIVQVACEKVDISRNTAYRWRKEDEQFRKDMDVALAEGEALVNDMSEHQLLTLIKEKNWPAISFWLRARHPKFGNKLEISGHIVEEERLSPEQEAIVRKAVELGSFTTNTKSDEEK